jgi:RNA polymerase sigma factor (sigma-70 family)
MGALQRFDPGRRTPFLAFATPTIVGTLRRSTTSVDAPGLGSAGPARVIGTTDASLVGVEDRIALRRGLAELDEAEVRLLTWYYFEERTQAQIARRLGVSQMQVSRLLAQAVQRLRPFSRPTSDASPSRPMTRRPGRGGRGGHRCAALPARLRRYPDGGTRGVAGERQLGQANRPWTRATISSALAAAVCMAPLRTYVLISFVRMSCTQPRCSSSSGSTRSTAARTASRASPSGTTSRRRATPPWSGRGGLGFLLHAGR